MKNITTILHWAALLEIGKVPEMPIARLRSVIIAAAGIIILRRPTVYKLEFQSQFISYFDEHESKQTAEKSDCEENCCDGEKTRDPNEKKEVCNILQSDRSERRLYIQSPRPLQLTLEIQQEAMQSVYVSSH